MPRKPRLSSTGLRAPAGLQVSTIDIGHDEIALLSYPVPPAGSVEGLTSAEDEVARAVVRGLSNGQIARLRSTSVRTVANQVASIFRKLRIGSRRELVALMESGSKPRVEP
jgi:DNA-binding NarL/FixJ family response regulator